LTLRASSTLSGPDVRAAFRDAKAEEVMVFSSHLFLFYFLPASLVLYYLSPRWLKHLTLTAVSYVFYGWANPLFVVLMFVSTLIDYLCGLALVGQLRPSTWRDPIPL
jgi:alginate O-acetyltransferase complex protein AlgI